MKLIIGADYLDCEHPGYGLHFAYILDFPLKKRRQLYRTG
jgi:hypothetical protein